MSFDWRNYHELAIELKKQAGTSPAMKEALLRASISRAYYSAYNVALEYAKQLGYVNPHVLPKIGIHDDLIQYFVSRISIDEECRTIALRLDTCKSQRTSADYKDRFDSKFSTLEDRTDLVIEKTKELLELIS